MLLAAAGCRREESSLPAHLALLETAPHTLPEPIGPDVPVVMLTVGLVDGSVHLDGPPLVVGGALRFERVLTRRWTDPPPYWALQTEKNGAGWRYWTPFDPTEIRHEDGLVRHDELRVALKLPFFPGGEVVFAKADGTVVGRLRLEKRPDNVPDRPVGLKEDATTGCAVPPEAWPAENLHPEECPQVYRIGGAVPPERALNLVVLPAGFLPEQLPAFRLAASRIADELVQRAPFRRYRDAVNVYRIDAASAHDGPIVRACSGCEHEKAAPSLAGDGLGDDGLGHPMRAEGTYSASCILADVEVEACPTSSPACKVLWPNETGLRRAWDLAACAPELNVLVILTNSLEWSGGGLDENNVQLAVVGLAKINREGQRARLLLHELGHALGLLDEYPTTNAAAPDFHTGRNVVRVDAEGRLGEIPWSPFCRDDDGSEGTCHYQCGRDCTSCPVGDPIPRVGLFEGGFYQSCGYYRAEAGCRMFDAETVRFCRACESYLTSLFDELGMEAEAD